MRGLKARPGYTLIELALCLALPLGLLLVCGLGYIGFHFLSKIW